MSRPICVHCGDPYGRRSTHTETIKHRDGEPEPRYTGNGNVIKARSWKTGQSRGSRGGAEFGPGEVVVVRDIWDGESWVGGYDPFCTLRCALSYARKAYRRHGRSV